MMFRRREAALVGVEPPHGHLLWLRRSVQVLRDGKAYHGLRLTSGGAPMTFSTRSFPSQIASSQIS